MMEILQNKKFIMILIGVLFLLSAYILWDKKKRKELEERLKTKTKKPLMKILIVLGIIILICGLLGIGDGLGIGTGYGFGEENLLNAKNEVEGEEEIKLVEEQTGNRFFEDLGIQEADEIYIRIRLRRIFLQETMIDSNELELFLKNNFDDSKKIIVQEDYADNETYEAIINMLENNGLPYTIQHL